MTMARTRGGKGTVWPSERRSFSDLLTGVTVTQLTNHCSHSNHIYFTNNGFYGDGKLIFGSDRENVTNLYSMDLHDGVITQLTDLERGRESRIQGTFLHPDGHEAYFYYDNSIMAINLGTMEERILYTIPENYKFGSLSCTADGQWLCFGLNKDLTQSIVMDTKNGYLGFEEYFRAKPHSMIMGVSPIDGTVKKLHEDQLWIGHVNTSPTQSHLLTFCHEGPWEQIDHRIWVLDIATGQYWKVKDKMPNEYVGHEYWLSDGIHIGYHGFTNSLEDHTGKIIGAVLFDNSHVEQYEFPFQNMHVHSNDLSLVIGDGQQTSAYHGQQFQDTIQVWRNEGAGFKGPRILCKHRGSFHSQNLHVHPRLSPDGKYVLFTSDMSGYGNLYMVDVPAFESLPEMPVT
ncbi:oligogalacturonide lyase [Paenibacillus sp. LMG 31461]|uniref:Oligogalacturonide lyase n=1 Tax=Paenibacillus plantarum TaxID=2654975 RepID=A0ABX1XLW3_9BACL|nr:oligogalacturonate lyase family protein [Paenibacillus plantarum]NOU69535.1 oligogalacturonide lyase [Paenibacillus plantarum]